MGWVPLKVLLGKVIFFPNGGHPLTLFLGWPRMCAAGERL